MITGKQRIYEDSMVHGGDGPNEPTYELRIDLTRDQRDNLEALCEVLKYSDLGSMLSDAVELFEWAVEQRAMGRNVGSSADPANLDEIVNFSEPKHGHER